MHRVVVLFSGKPLAKANLPFFVSEFAADFDQLFKQFVQILFDADFASDVYADFSCIEPCRQTVVLNAQNIGACGGNDIEQPRSEEFRYSSSLKQ